MDKKRSTHQFWKLTGIFIETFIVNNIVLIQAIGICPIIAVGTNLKYGVALTLCTAAVLPVSYTHLTLPTTSRV